MHDVVVRVPLGELLGRWTVVGISAFVSDAGRAHPLDALGRVYDAALGHGYDVVGVCPAELHVVAAFAAHAGLPFPVVADPALRLARAAGMVAERTVGRSTREVAVASAVLVDAVGTVVASVVPVEVDLTGRGVLEALSVRAGTPVPRGARPGEGAP